MGRAGFFLVLITALALPAAKMASAAPITIPYVASPERHQQIEGGFPKIRSGMTLWQVLDVLGYPDEIQPRYQPTKTRGRKRIGTTYQYYLEKKAGDHQKLVRVVLDLSGHVWDRDWVFSNPYVASPERQKQIKEGFPKIKPGMTPEQMKAILGDPDEVLPLYEPKIKTGKRIGATYWYYLEKKGRDKEKVVRISLDLSGHVTEVDPRGLSAGGGN